MHFLQRKKRNYIYNDFLIKSYYIYSFNHFMLQCCSLSLNLTSFHKLKKKEHSEPHHIMYYFCTNLLTTLEDKIIEEISIY